MAGQWVDCSTIAAVVMVDVCGLDVDVAQKYVKAWWILLVKITRDFACHPRKSFYCAYLKVNSYITYLVRAWACPKFELSRGIYPPINNIVVIIRPKNLLRASRGHGF
jgi:hypothetical protein